MEPRDPELDQMLEGLRQGQASELELHRWQRAVQSALRIQRRVRGPWALLAAMVLGALIGGGATVTLAKARFCPEASQQLLAPNNARSNATIELTYVKLD